MTDTLSPDLPRLTIACLIRLLDGLEASSHLPRAVSVIWHGSIHASLASMNRLLATGVAEGWNWAAMHELDLTDAAGALALRTALGLAFGLDPGERSHGISWRRDGPGWRLEGTVSNLLQRGCVWFESRDEEQLADVTSPGGGDAAHEVSGTLFIHAPDIAAEDDSNRALIRAVMLRLKRPELVPELAAPAPRLQK